MDRSWIRRHLNQLLFGLYLFLVWSSYIYVYYYDWSIPAGGGIALTLAGIMLALLVLCVPPLFRMVSSLSVHPGRKATLLKKLLVFSASFLASYVILRMWRHTCGYFDRPEGLFFTDSLDQLDQAVSGRYSDWHPVWHTLLFFKLPLALTGKQTSIVLFQSIVFSLSVAFMAETAYEIAGTRSAVLCWSVVLLNPYTGYMSLHPYKDVAFAAAALPALCLVVRFWCAGPDRPVSRRLLILTGLLLANASLFRHNGILLTLILLLALLFILGRKRWFLVAAVFVLFMILVKGPVYHALNVEKPDRRVVETVGLPLTVIGNVAANNPDAMDEELREFAYSVLSPDEWTGLYRTGSFNSVKSRCHLDVIDSAGRGKVLHLMFKCFRLAPREALQGLLSLTEIVYSIEGDSHDYLFGVNYYIKKPEPFTISFLSAYELFFEGTVLNYLRYIGVTMLLVLLPMLARCDLWSGRDWQRILIALSLFSYNFGTMLLLTGWDFRFFFVSFLCSPILCILMLYEKNDGKKESCP